MDGDDENDHFDGAADVLGVILPAAVLWRTLTLLHTAEERWAVNVLLQSTRECLAVHHVLSGRLLCYLLHLC